MSNTSDQDYNGNPEADRIEAEWAGTGERKPISYIGRWNPNEDPYGRDQSDDDEDN